MTAKQQRNIHAKRYIQAVFEQMLKEEGFVCPDEKLLCWYRLKGQEVINSIIFCSPWTNLPLNLGIGYGILPLFEKPVYTRNVIFSRPSLMGEECFCEKSIVEDCPINEMGYRPYADDIAVYAPAGDGKGLFTLEGILLPAMNKLNDINDVYEYHKHRRKMRFAADAKYKLGVLSKTFIEMALSVEDEEVYPQCKERIPEAISLYKGLCAKFPAKKEYQHDLNDWELLHAAFFDGSRSEYLMKLDTQKESNLVYLRKSLGVIP